MDNAPDCIPPVTSNETSTKKHSESAKRVALFRERRRNGVIFVIGLEILPRDLAVLCRRGFLATDDPAKVTREQVTEALGALLDDCAAAGGLVCRTPVPCTP